MHERGRHRRWPNYVRECVYVRAYAYMGVSLREHVYDDNDNCNVRISWRM